MTATYQSFEIASSVRLLASEPLRLYRNFRTMTIVCAVTRGSNTAFHLAARKVSSFSRLVGRGRRNLASFQLHTCTTSRNEKLDENTHSKDRSSTMFGRGIDSYSVNDDTSLFVSNENANLNELSQIQFIGTFHIFEEDDGGWYFKKKSYSNSVLNAERRCK